MVKPPAEGATGMEKTTREAGVPGAKGVRKRGDDGYDTGKGPKVSGAEGSHCEILKEELRLLIMRGDLSQLHN